MKIRAIKLKHLKDPKIVVMGWLTMLFVVAITTVLLTNPHFPDTVEQPPDNMQLLYDKFNVIYHEYVYDEDGDIEGVIMWWNTTEHPKKHPAFIYDDHDSDLYVEWEQIEYTREYFGWA